MRAQDIKEATKSQTPLAVRDVPGSFFISKVYVTGGGEGFWTATSDPEHLDPAKVFDPRVFDAELGVYGAWVSSIPSIRFLGEWEEASRTVEAEGEEFARKQRLRGERSAKELQIMTDLADEVRGLLGRDNLLVYPESSTARSRTKHYVRIELKGAEDVE